MTQARINREELLAALEAVQPGLSAREVLEQSSCFVLDKGRIHTFNDEVACSAPVKLNGIKGAVQAAPLLAVLRKLTEEEVTIEQGEGELVVQGKRRKAGVRMEAEVMLPLASMEKPKSWLPLPEDYGEALAMVQECAGKDLSQFATACVHLHPKWMEAFDNYQLMRYRMKTGVEKPTLVKKDSVKHVCTMGATEFAETESWIHYRNPTGLVISCRRFMEDFVDLTPHVQVEGAAIALPKGLAQATEIAEIFSGENADNNQVMVQVKQGKLRVRGQGVSGWYQEFKDVKYTGPALNFLISPRLLASVVENYNECVVNPTRIKASGGKWVFVAVLGSTDDGTEE